MKYKITSQLKGIEAIGNLVIAESEGDLLMESLQKVQRQLKGKKLRELIKLKRKSR